MSPPSAALLFCDAPAAFARPRPSIRLPEQVGQFAHQRHTRIRSPRRIVEGKPGQLRHGPLEFFLARFPTRRSSAEIPIGRAIVLSPPPGSSPFLQPCARPDPANPRPWRISCARYIPSDRATAELSGHGRVVCNHVRQHERIGPAVGHAEARSEGMRQRVIHAHRRIGKRHRSNARGVVHHAARLFIVRDARKRWADT